MNFSSVKSACPASTSLTKPGGEAKTLVGAKAGSPPKSPRDNMFVLAPTAISASFVIADLSAIGK
jgi:hypothetical protein